MNMTADYLTDVIGRVCRRPDPSNVRSMILGLTSYGEGAGLDRPHRLPKYLGQLTLESGEFRYDREIWGPTAAQKRYEGRKDLGNIHPGDGAKFKGFTPIQITGRANTTEFYAWCAKRFGKCVPDFVETPTLMNTDPWEGLGPIWYWDTRGINRLADVNDVRAVTRRINGGYNHLAERINYTRKYSLVLTGFAPTDLKGFQRSARITVDGLWGPQSDTAIHRRLETNG